MEARLSTVRRTNPSMLAIWLVVLALALLAAGWTGYRLGQVTSPAAHSSVASDPGGLVYPDWHDSHLPSVALPAPGGLVYPDAHDSRLPGAVQAQPTGVAYPDDHDSRAPGSGN
jgi:hypothetical protein